MKCQKSNFDKTFIPFYSEENFGIKENFCDMKLRRNTQHEPNVPYPLYRRFRKKQHGPFQRICWIRDLNIVSSHVHVQRYAIFQPILVFQIGLKFLPIMSKDTHELNQPMYKRPIRMLSMNMFGHHPLILSIVTISLEKSQK